MCEVIPSPHQRRCRTCKGSEIGHNAGQVQGYEPTDARHFALGTHAKATWRKWLTCPPPPGQCDSLYGEGSDTGYRESPPNCESALTQIAEFTETPPQRLGRGQTGIGPIQPAPARFDSGQISVFGVNARIERESLSELGILAGYCREYPAIPAKDGQNAGIHVNSVMYKYSACPKLRQNRC
jgi:hypothetical protein